MTLELAAIEHGYGRRTSLRGVSLRLEPGDRYAFLGHNGAGKTTTLRIACGLIRPRRGTVRIDGFDALAWPREARARIGALIEEPRFHTGWSGRANLAALARVRGFDRRGAQREADRVLELVGMSPHGDRRVGGYSQGMRQRLGIAQALLGAPRYLLLDEPLNGLDPEGIAAMRALFTTLAAEGTGVLLSSHQLAEVAGFCDRVSVVQDGRTLCEQPLATLVDAVQRGVTLTTDDAATTAAVLDAAGIGYAIEPAGAEPSFRVSVGGAAATADLVRRLVAAGVDVHAVVPSRASLEEAYLRLTRGDSLGMAPTAHPPLPRTAAPAERRAPRGPLRRAIGYDLRRALRSPWVWAGFLAPVPLALREVQVRAAEVDARLAQLRSGELFDVDDATAFEGLGLGLRLGLPLLVLVAVAFASQTFAGELGQGTLRNLAMAPLRRAHLATAKLVVALGLPAGAFAVLAGATWVASAASLGVQDKATLFARADDGFERDPYVTVDAMLAQVPPMLGASLLALLACAAIAAACSAIAHRGVQALVAALLVVLALDLGRGPLAELGLAWLSPVEGLPSPLRDESPIRSYLDAVLGLAESRPGDGSGAWWLPWAWIAGAAVVAVLATRGRALR